MSVVMLREILLREGSGSKNRVTKTLQHYYFLVFQIWRHNFTSEY